MKKALSLILAVLMLSTMALCFAGCGEAKPKTDANGNITGETYDVGKFTVIVPNGWAAFPASDYFDDYEGDFDPTSITLCKGAKSEMDTLSKPTISIKYYGVDDTGTDIEFTKAFYDDVTDIEPITLGERTYTGFNCSSLDYPYTILWTDNNDVQIQVTIGTRDSISANDADVQAIIASITDK